MRPAIRVDSLSKSYRLGQQKRADYKTLRESLTGAAAGAWGRLKRAGSRLLGKESASPSDPGDFWALKDVSFEVRPGEVVGIIGRNGAGKSTLLKILSRITEPTSGRAEVRGRMGSLLEVGTGFHPELTGRENIFLNGSILGMNRREINRKFDEIVAFSEVEQFLDTPVKRYSSGMYVRLAFAVAAHLELEILVVDEVLAVGDVAFQEKCLGKMRNVSQGGRTVLLVSHNMSAIKSLCSRVIAVEKGQVVQDSAPAEVIRRFLKVDEHLIAEWIDHRIDPPGQETIARFMALRITDALGEPTPQVFPRQPFFIEIDYEICQKTSCQVAFRMNDESGVTVFTTADGDWDFRFARSRQPGNYRTRVQIPEHFLAPGRYHLLAAINRGGGDKPYDLLENVLNFQVDIAGSLKQIDGRWGCVTPQLKWEECSINLPKVSSV